MKILIGGQALRQLGSDRHTDDMDYLIYDENNSELFIKDGADDLINAAANGFYRDVWQANLSDADILSPALLLETKAYSLIQHMQNGKWDKADAAEYDIKFLVRKFGVSDVSICARHVSSGEIKEVIKIIREVR